MTLSPKWCSGFERGLMGGREYILEPSFDKPGQTGKNLQVVRETSTKRLLSCLSGHGWMLPWRRARLVGTQEQGSVGFLFLEELANRVVSVMAGLS